MIILASGSARRRELLQQVGVPFVVQVFEIDESVQANESPSAYVERLAIAKARAALPHVASNSIVIAADTTVTIDGHILGKPVDQADAFAMWRLLSGRTHQVLTAVAVAQSTAQGGAQTVEGSVQGERLHCQVVCTEVTFLPLTAAQMLAYWQTGEPIGKAGAYAIQGIGAAWIPRIAGSYSNVVGLPLVETLALLAEIAPTAATFISPCTERDQTHG